MGLADEAKAALAAEQEVSGFQAQPQAGAVAPVGPLAPVAQPPQQPGLAERSREAAGRVPVAPVPDQAPAVDDPTAGLAEPRPNVIGELFEAVSGAGRLEELPPEVRNNPEIIQSLFNPFPAGSAFNPSLGNTFDSIPAKQQLQIVGGLLSSADPQGQIDVIQAALPQATFRTENGTTIVTIQGEDFLLNRPGLSGQDRAQAVAFIGAMIPTAKWARMGVSLAEMAFRGIVGGAATSLAVDELAQEFGSEQPPSAGRAVATGLGEAVGPAISGIRAARAATRADRILQGTDVPLQGALAEIAAAEKTTAATGVTFDPAQQTMNQFALEQRAFLGQQAAGAPVAKPRLEAQQAEIVAATEQFLGKLAPAGAVGAASGRIQQASQQEIARIIRARELAAGPHYRAAFAEPNVSVDVRPTLGRIKSALQKRFKEGPIANELKGVRKIIEGSAQKTPGAKAESNLEALHGAKIQLDDMIEGAVRTEKTSLARELVTIQKSLVARMGRASKEYDLGRAAFEQASGPVDEFGLSFAQRVAGLTGEQLEGAPSRVFKTLERMEELKALSLKSDPTGESFNAFQREFISDRISKILPKGIQESGEEPLIGLANEAAKLRSAIFGNASQRQIMLRALPSDEMRQNFRFLEDAMRRAAAGFPGGSQTGIRKVISDRIESSSLAVRRFFKNPIERLIETGEESAFNRNVRVMADVAYNPKWKPDIDAIRKIRNPTKQGQALLQFLNRLAIQAAQDEPEDAQPQQPQGNGSLRF